MTEDKIIAEALERLAPPPAAHYPLIQRVQTTVSAATATRPDSPDAISVGGSAGYDVIPVYTEKKRLSQAIWVLNDGPGTLYVIVSADGKSWTGEGIS
jgi:hypothetical protein